MYDLSNSNNKKIILILIIISFIIPLLISCNSVHNKEEQINKDEIITQVISWDNSPAEVILSEGWFLQSSESIKITGEDISGLDQDISGWYKTDVPSTVMAALVKNHEYEDPYYSKNMKEISGTPFSAKKSWWYRKEFYLDDENINACVRLGLDGINYRANIWLNGSNISNSDNIFGTFRRFLFDISGNIKAGKNVLAIEVFGPERGEFTIGFVDWAPVPPDNNMGIWREVKLYITGEVSINNPFVYSNVNEETLNDAELTVTAELINHSNEDVSGDLTGKIEDINFSMPVFIKSGERKFVVFNPEEYAELNIENARLWWPNNMGEQNLYNLELSFNCENIITDHKEVRFGIREVTDYINEKGYRGYKINGKKILIKGGGWVDDLFLGDTREKTEAQIKYVQHINLNTIRLEGFWGKDHTFFDLCDEYGILVMPGWSCQWEWADYAGKVCDDFGAIKSESDMELIAESLGHQIKWHRNHPSVFVWLTGSDKLPRPELELMYKEVIDKFDPSRPYLGSAGTAYSSLSGPTGVKMNGPYKYVPPLYWYEDKNNGGAYGFNTETGPGAQPPPIESIKKMIPENKQWPLNDYWSYHCAGGEFSNLNHYYSSLKARYGEPKNLEEFCEKAQVMNYEAMRPMFESFESRMHITTGIIQWMLNSAWPAMFWQLYDHYLMPNGAFYAAKKACSPLHILYDYGNEKIHIVNNTLTNINSYSGQIQIYNLNSIEKYNKTIKFDAPENSSFILTELPEIKDLSEVYFVKLTIMDNSNKPVVNNFYWLSKEKDIIKYSATEWYYTPTKKHMDLSALNNMNEAELDIQAGLQEYDNEIEVIVEMKNTSNIIAFFTYLSIEDRNTGETILPVFWEDNYISLLPGEERILRVYFNADGLAYSDIQLKISGYNVEEIIIKDF